jgi:hypothetical protein
VASDLNRHDAEAKAVDAGQGGRVTEVGTVLKTKARQMVPNGPPEQSPKSLLQRFLHPELDPAKLAALRNNPKWPALADKWKALRHSSSSPDPASAGGAGTACAPVTHQDPQRELQQVREFQALLYQDLDQAFGTKRDIDAFWCFSENIHDLLRARDRLEALKVALKRYPCEVALIYPHVHQTLCHCQSDDAEEFLRQVVSLEFPDTTWRARCQLQLGLLYGLKGNYVKALVQLDNSLPVLRQAAAFGDDWQVMVTGEADDGTRPQSWQASFGEEILLADLITAKATAAAGYYARAIDILCSTVREAELLAQILPDQPDRDDVMAVVRHDLETLCKALGGKLAEPVTFDETLSTDAHGKLLSDIYYGLYLCFSASERSGEAASARARHNLF